MDIVVVSPPLVPSVAGLPAAVHGVSAIYQAELSLLFCLVAIYSLV